MKLKLITLLLLLAGIASSQDTAQMYYSKGNPDKWTVEATAFAFLPWASGNIEVGQLETGFSVSNADILKSLQGAAFIQAGISKGRFMSQATYVFTRLETESASARTIHGESVAVKMADLNMNVLQVDIGTRLDVHKKVLMDMFAGFRYDRFHAFADITTIRDSMYSADKSFDFWDPLFGISAHYFPHPRVPLSLSADVGGFSAGSDFSWKTSLTGGYAVSPLIDLTGGFTAYGFEFNELLENGRPASFQTVLYGFTMGATMYFPKRFKDPAIFKKSKK